MSDRPRVIHACKTTIDQDNGFSIEFRDWWPIKIHEAATSYTRTDLVDEKDKRITALEDALREAACPNDAILIDGFHYCCYEGELFSILNTDKLLGPCEWCKNRTALLGDSI